MLISSLESSLSNGTQEFDDIENCGEPTSIIIKRIPVSAEMH